MATLNYTFIDGTTIDIMNELNKVRYNFNESIKELSDIKDEDMELYKEEMINRFRIVASNISNKTNYVSKDRIVIFEEINNIFKSYFNI